MNTIKTPIIIEFAGLHGSGKTTTSYKLAEVLRNRGYVVKTNHDFWQDVSRQNKFKRWVNYFLKKTTIFFIMAAILNILKKKINILEIKNKHNHKDIIGPIKDIQARDYIFLNYWQDVDFIILDEGSVYVTVDLVWKYKVSKNFIKEYLEDCKYLKRTKLFLFQLNTNLSVARVENRKDNSFIDKLNRESIRNELTEIKEYYEFLYNYLGDKDNVFFIDPNATVESRIDEIINKVINQ